MITRRDYLKNSALTVAALSLPASLLKALEGDIITRAIPSSGEQIPIDRKSTRLNSSHSQQSRMPSSA